MAIQLGEPPYVRLRLNGHSKFAKRHHTLLQSRTLGCKRHQMALYRSCSGRSAVIRAMVADGLDEITDQPQVAAAVADMAAGISQGDGLLLCRAELGDL